MGSLHAACTTYLGLGVPSLASRFRWKKSAPTHQGHQRLLGWRCWICSRQSGRHLKANGAVLAAVPMAPGPHPMASPKGGWGAKIERGPFAPFKPPKEGHPHQTGANCLFSPARSKARKGTQHLYTYLLGESGEAGAIPQKPPLQATNQGTVFAG